MPLPTQPPPFWPRFDERVRSVAVTARVGRVLGIAVAICFVTGLLSHYQYHPWSWLPEPATPADGYRITQGVHVTTGIASIPLLLVKLWSVYPRLFAWPPARSFVHLVERLSVGVLVAVALVELGTGLLNILAWYPWPWPFVAVHRFLAYVLAGSVLLHVAVKLPVIQAALRRPLSVDEQLDGGITRRGLLAATGAGVTLLVATTVGQSVGRLEPLAVLAPRRPKDGPQGVPVNRTARQAGITRVGDEWRLAVDGPQPFTLTLAELEASVHAARRLPIACVEGWSVDAHWRGVWLLDVVRRAGGTADSTVRVHSLERHGGYRSSEIAGSQLAGALLATHLNGERLDLDHGYPVRLIAPDRAGVLNTKWIGRVEVR